MKIDSKKLCIIILYILLSIVFILLIPKLISFSPTGSTSTSFWNTSSGKSIIVLIQVIVGIFLAIVFFVLISKSTGFSEKNGKNLVNQGSAKQGTVSELRELTVPVNNTRKGEGGFTLSKRIRLSAEKSYEHVAIIGPTGAGKSTSFFIPCLLDADGTHSFVVTDPKGELHKLTSTYLKSLGMRVIKLDPLHPDINEFFYNPIYIAEDQTDIREVAQLILMNGAKAIEIAMGSSGGGSQSEWINMAVPLFTASLAYCKKLGKKKTVNEAIDIILKSDLKQMEELFMKDDIAYRQFLIFKTSSESEKTMSSIKSVLTSNIQLFLDEKIETFTKTPFTMDTATGKLKIDESKLFHPKMLREQPTALFVCVEEVKSDYMAPLMSVFYNQLLSFSNSIFYDNYKIPILYMLDEFANIGVIPIITKIITTARSRKIGISLGLQDIEQLKQNYGAENANTILTNLKSKIVYAGLSGDSAKYISDLAGVTTVTSISYSSGGDNPNGNVLSKLINGKNKQISGVQRPVLTPDEVRRLETDEVLIIAHNKNVVKDLKNTYYTQKRYLNKIPKELLNK